MSPLGFLLIVIALAFLWLGLMRPQRRRQRQQLDMWESLQEGDEVVTAGGIYGEIAGFRGDDVLVRIAPELEVRVARRAIAGVIREEAGGEAEDEHEQEADSGARNGDEGRYPEEPQ
jgi:preprotein translocase subunit YajC